MAPDLVLTLDAGTGSSRACVYSITENRPLAVAARDCPIEHPAPNMAEWQPAAWWQAISEATAQAVAEAARPATDYLGTTVTSLRQGFVLLGEQGEPLAPGVLNYDRRGADYIRLIEEAMSIEELYPLTGHWHAPELTLPKLLWFQHERPEVWQKARLFLFVHDWLLFRLTGQPATAASMITAGQMGDCAARGWAADLLEQLRVPAELLPPVLEGGALLGGLLPAVAAELGLRPGLPVHVGGGDTQFGCLGAGGLGPDRAVIVGGSTTPIMLTTDRPLFDPLRYPWVSPHLQPGLWAVETIAGHTGMLYKWFRDAFGQAQVAQARAQDRGDYAVLNELAAGAPLGADGLLVVATSPRWAQDTWQRKAPYLFYDFQVSHTTGHAARAIMEGVCFGVRGNLEQLERVAGTPLEEILFTGGSASVPFWAQMMADVLGRPLVVPEVTEPAAAAGAQLVLWGQGGRRTLPRPALACYEPDPVRTAAYEPVYRAYLEVFEKVQRHFGT
jgi:sugar (pentulose or hexulose) kinase